MSEAVGGLVTERLRLRRLGEDDAAFILELLTSRGFREGVGDRGVADLKDARRYIADGPAASHAADGFGLDLVETREDAQPIGICGLVRRAGLQGPDLGYAFLERAWGRGYAVEVGAATLDDAERRLGLKRVWAVTKRENAASVAVLRRLDFAVAGHVLLNGVENLLFAWSPQREAYK